MIKTKRFAITKSEYLSIICRVLIKKKWWLFILAWLIGITFSIDDKKDMVKIFIMVFAFIYPLLVFFEYWRFANSKQNKLIYIERQHEIFEDKIISQVGNVSESIIAIENFVKTVELKDVYLLYISKYASVYFPKRIFQTKEDENWFKEKIFLPIKRRQ